jgi:hypothetical protein
MIAIGSVRNPRHRARRGAARVTDHARFVADVWLSVPRASARAELPREPVARPRSARDAFHVRSLKLHARAASRASSSSQIVSRISTPASSPVYSMFR